MSKRYVYAIMEERCAPELEPTKAVGNPEAMVEVTCLNGLAVLSSATDLDEVMATRRNMLAHTKVLEQAMEYGAILPFSFGTVVDDMAGVEALIASGTDAFSADLKRLEGCMEIGLRANWDEKRIFAEIVDEDPDLRALALEVRTKPTSETYHTRIDLGQRAEKLMASKRDAEGEALHTLASAFAIDVRRHSTSADMVVLDAAYLIETSREAELVAALEAVDAEAKGRLSLKIISPAPPYNFVSVNMAHDQLEAA